MSRFYKIDGGFSSATTEELNRIALECGGHLVSIGYGYATRGKIENRVDGWSAKWINRGGMGNHGSLVLVGTTPLTRAFRREAALAQMVKAVAA
jgi:hypothetical protein